jgi:hypothetical protein
MGFITSRCCCGLPPWEYYDIQRVQTTGQAFDAYLVRRAAVTHDAAAATSFDEWKLPLPHISLGGSSGTAFSIWSARKSGDGTLWAFVRLSSSTAGVDEGYAYLIADVDENNPQLLHFVRMPTAPIPDGTFDFRNGSIMLQPVSVNRDRIQSTYQPESAPFGRALFRRIDAGAIAGTSADLVPNDTDYTTFWTARRSDKAIGWRRVITHGAGNVIARVEDHWAIGTNNGKTITNPTEILSTDVRAAAGSSVALVPLPLIIGFDTALDGGNEAWGIIAHVSGQWTGFTFVPDDAPTGSRYRAFYSTNVMPSTPRIYVTVPIGTQPVLNNIIGHPFLFWPTEYGSVLTLSRLNANDTSARLELRESSVQWSRDGWGLNPQITVTADSEGGKAYIRQMEFANSNSTMQLPPDWQYVIPQDQIRPGTGVAYNAWVASLDNQVFVPHSICNGVTKRVTQDAFDPHKLDVDLREDSMTTTKAWLQNPTQATK